MNGETSNIKILLVEDDKALAITISNLLRVKGYEVTHAGDGAAGIQKAFALLPDLILCDISMNEISGYDVFNVLKESSATAMIPFVFLTAKSDLKEIRFGMQLGADDYIVKPFEYDELLTSIATRLNKAEAHRKANEEKFIALSMISPYGIYIYQGDKFIETNPSLSSVIGYSREELLGMGFSDIIVEQDRAAAIDKITRCQRGFEKEIHIKFKVRHKDGHIINIELYGIEGLKVKGRSSLLGVFNVLKPDVQEKKGLESLSLKDIEEFEKAVDLISGNRSYVSTELINRLIAVFKDNETIKEKSTEDVICFSNRELEVLGLVCKGLSTKEIADNLFISSRTVEKHRANLMTKTEAKNIIEVIIYAVKHKLIDI
ncbi:MAG: response regulator [Lentimicrobiaceae bacterium]|nr:response regulator [Lentimicrobiaceae bacterium]MCB9023146.1 response regulator [Lentimicrobiaceae bacterium]MCO5266854.1 response regulator [Lentimicrobium sp.]